MPDSHANFAYSTVATAPVPASSGVSLTVQSGDGAKFPATPFNATVWPAGEDPLTALNPVHRVGDQIAATITVKTLTDIENNETAISVSAGNTSGTLTLISTGTAYLAGGNNITLSQHAQSITISAPNTAGTATTISAVASANVIGTNTRWALEDHQHAGLAAGGVSGGNTSGNTGSSQGTVWFKSRGFRRRRCRPWPPRVSSAPTRAGRLRIISMPIRPAV